MKRFALLLLLSVSLFAQEKPVVISGLAFGDYYVVPSHHDERVEGMNGFWIRRGYLTVDRALSDELFARIRFELNQAGDFRTNATLEPYVKDAFIRWRRSPALELYIGLSPSPAIETVERVWGYRSVEKTVLDLHRVIATRDLGIAAAGTYGRVKYQAQIGNGSATGTETNEGKKVAASMSLAPTAATLVDVYADFEDRPGATNRTTLQGIGAIQTERYRIALQYGLQFRDQQDDFDAISLFGSYNLSPRWALLGRVDRADANPEGDRIPYVQLDPARASTMFLAGADWKLHKNLSIIPNVMLFAYEDGGEDDLFGKVTFSFSF